MTLVAGEVVGTGHGASSRINGRSRARSRGHADPFASLTHTATIPRCRPLAYGYVRVPRHDDAADLQVHASEQRIRIYATTHELDLVGIRHNVHPGVDRTWSELVAELETAGGRYVIVPTVDDLSSHPLLRLMMCDRLARRTYTDILVLGDRP